MATDRDLLLRIGHLAAGRNPAGAAGEMSEGTLLELVNYDFEGPGLVKRAGAIYYDQGAESVPVRSMHAFKPTHRPEEIVYTADGSIKRLDGSGSEDTMKTGFFSDEWDAVQRRGQLYMVNEKDGLIMYDGAVQKYPSVEKATTIAVRGGVLFLGRDDLFFWTDGAPGSITFPVDNWGLLSSMPGDAIVKLVSIRQQVFALTQFGVVHLRAIGANAYGESPIVKNRFGCASRTSVADCGEHGVCYLANDGGGIVIVKFDGASPQIISAPIEPDMKKIDRSYAGYASGVFYRGQYRVSVREESGTHAVHVYDFLRRGWTRFEGFDFSTACVDGKGRHWLGDNSGNLLEYGYGRKDKWTAIATVLQTPFHEAGTLNAKSIKAAALLATRSGNADMTVTWYRDWRHDAMDTQAVPMAPESPYFYWGQSGAVLDAGDDYFGPARKAHIEAGIRAMAARSISVKWTENGLQGTKVFGYDIYGKLTPKG